MNRTRAGVGRSATLKTPCASHNRVVRRMVAEQVHHHLIGVSELEQPGFRKAVPRTGCDAPVIRDGERYTGLLAGGQRSHGDDAVALLDGFRHEIRAFGVVPRQGLAMQREGDGLVEIQIDAVEGKLGILPRELPDHLVVTEPAELAAPLGGPTIDGRLRPLARLPFIRPFGDGESRAALVLDQELDQAAHHAEVGDRTAKVAGSKSVTSVNPGFDHDPIIRRYDCGQPAAPGGPQRDRLAQHGVDLAGTQLGIHRQRVGESLDLSTVVIFGTRETRQDDAHASGCVHSRSGGGDVLVLLVLFPAPGAAQRRDGRSRFQKTSSPHPAIRSCARLTYGNDQGYVSGICTHAMLPENGRMRPIPNLESDITNIEKGVTWCGAVVSNAVGNGVNTRRRSCSCRCRPWGCRLRLEFSFIRPLGRYAFSAMLDTVEVPKSTVPSLKHSILGQSELNQPFPSHCQIMMESSEKVCTKGRIRNRIAFSPQASPAIVVRKF